ncbi:TetR family transcriptional regulator [Modestobacter sp. VKM Ac-2979]|uniref:TetR/AcrR family transcriptional regulator n=1 Tax=unclassified Modestobacter TaxID=2643866 RepID=UPI0022AB921C|nr:MULTISPECIES: TetR family transcriptional regulator [unclassified Modestobacter]MCZ2812000.1 TetR family transcriptional regulator [Modestobacter sp. VKM Ac-2979]MCZ2843724.1 TetR family transcriptional regulator [Modestobacter sp. VKM Ac-2980]
MTKRIDGPPRQVRASRKRVEILRAAVILMTAHGTAAVTHRSVAQAAGVSLGAIRYYFATREALLLACVDHVETERATAAEDVLATAQRRPPADAGEVAALLLTAYYGPRQDDATLAGTLGWVVDCARESDALSTRVARARAVMDRQVGDLLDACDRSEVPATLVGAVIDGSVVTATAEGERGIADRALRELIGMLQIGARARAHPR